MWEQVLKPGVEQRRQPLEHVTQVSPGVVSVHACRLYEAHHDGGTLARELAAHELPCLASHGPGLDLPLKVVVVQCDGAVFKVLRQRDPVVQRVVDGLRRSAAVGYQSALKLQLLAQFLP